MNVEFKPMDFLLGFVLPNVVLIVGGAIVFTLARRWPWRVLGAVGVLVLVGIGLLRFAVSKGVRYEAETGKVHYGSPAAEVACLVGLPVVSVGVAVLGAGLLPAEPRWVGRSGAVKDVAARVALVWMGSGIVGFVLHSLMNGPVR